MLILLYMEFSLDGKGRGTRYFLTVMGVDNGGTGTNPPECGAGGLSPQILSCCTILSTR